ncbi:MAG: Mpv17/PMP22 family protein [Bacteroidota bacterium]
MKRSDLIAILCVILFLLPFFLFQPVFDFYKDFNFEHAYWTSFIKFAILATFGESIGLRIRTGQYTQPDFGFLPRALVWGFLGISIKMAFVIFGEGGPIVLKNMGISGVVPDILRKPDFSWIKLFSAFTVSALLNIFFAPVFMTFHKITDLHILANKGTMRGFLTPIDFRLHFTDINWAMQWDFVFKKTIPLFWIPAQTLNFMLPEEYRILFAAFLSIILGILLSLATRQPKN